jgi:hypothetical protein
MGIASSQCHSQGKLQFFKLMVTRSITALHDRVGSTLGRTCMTLGTAGWLGGMGVAWVSHG